MTFPKRYAIYLADLNPTVGGEIRKVRPVVVVSRKEMNRFLDTVVVCPLTSCPSPPSCILGGVDGYRHTARGKMLRLPWTRSAPSASSG